MSIQKYYTEEELVHLVQSGQFTMVDYVLNQSTEMNEDYKAFCRQQGCPMNDNSAFDFLSVIEAASDF